MRLSYFTNLSIRQKQTLILMLTSAVALLLASSGFVIYELMIFRDEMTRSLSVLALRVAEQNSGPLEFSDSLKAEQNLKAMLGYDPTIVAACIYTEDGKPFAVYPSGPKKKFAPPPLQADGHKFGQNRLTLFLRVEVSKGLVVPVYLQSNLDMMYMRFQRYAGIVVVVFAISLLAALILSTQLQRVISEPIVNLLATARTVSDEKNYAVRAVKRSNDELGRLIDGFNNMLAQIQERDLALQKAHDQLEKRVEERTLALQIEIGDRRRAEFALQQQLTRISLLNQIAHLISERQDLQRLTQVVLVQLETHFAVDFGAMLLYEPKDELLTTMAVRRKNPASNAQATVNGALLNPARLGLGECVRGKTVYTNNATGESAALREWSGADLHAMVACPLMVENNTFGILICGRAQGEFSSGECEFLRMLSEQVALAAHQARLYTELQTAYNELRQTQQSIIEQERLRALGKMSSGIAHDINNALSPVVAYADMLLHEPNLSENAQKYLNNIKTAGEDIAHIVSRMREFYRRREQNEPLFSVNLDKLVREVIDLTRPRWRDIPQQRGMVINVETDLDPATPEILGNASELREALTNLILNAIEAMPAGGKIVVRTRARKWEKSLVGRRPTHVVLEVCDTGLGMDEETRSRCLEPFFTTKGYRGTGLGLAMVYGVAERHEAKIEIESSVGQGTIMRLIFPIREITEAKPTDQSGDDHKPAPLRILCIDDEPLLRELLKDLLEVDGHTVELADGGEAGIAAFLAARGEHKPFDVVITDLGMPHVDGRKLAQALKKESPQTPVVMLTGWGTMMKADGDLPPQVDAVLSKPPRMSEIRATLQQVTRKTETEALSA